MKLVKHSLLVICWLAVCCLALPSLADEQSQAPEQPQPPQPPADPLAEAELDFSGQTGDEKKLENAASSANETTPLVSGDSIPPPSIEQHSQTVSTETAPSSTEAPLPSPPPPPPPPPSGEQSVTSVTSEPSISTTPTPQDPPSLTNTTTQEVSSQDATAANETTTPTPASNPNTTDLNQPDPLTEPRVEHDLPLSALGLEEPLFFGPQPVVSQLAQVPATVNTPAISSQAALQIPPDQTVQHNVSEVVALNTTTIHTSPQDTLNQTSQAIAPVVVEPAISPVNQVSNVAPQPIVTVLHEPSTNTTLQLKEKPQSEITKVLTNEVPTLLQIEPMVTQNVNQEAKVNSTSPREAHGSTDSILDKVKNLTTDPFLPLTLEPGLMELEYEQIDENATDQKTANFWYTFNKGTCNSKLPEPILNQTITKILSNFLSSNCTDQVRFKLGPFENKKIRGYVMETSGVVLSLSQLLHPRLAIHIQCQDISLASDQMIDLSLNVSLISQDAWLESRWRRYPRTKNLDEIPLELPSEMGKLKSILTGSASLSQSSSSSRDLLSGASAKCQRFKIQGGTYKFGLANFEGEFGYLVGLKKVQGGAYQLSQVRVQHFRLKRLHLAPSALLINGNSGANLYGGSPATVQILHDQNNHHRRNNWLLDLYANWLRHEYRGQLRSQLFPGSAIVNRLNGSCKLSGAHKALGANNSLLAR